MRTNLKNLTISNPDYLACIAWKDQYGRMYRYMLWDEIGETRPLGFPLYQGQLIRKNFRIEIWSISGENVTESVGQNIITSVLQGIDYRYGTDTAIGNSDGQVLDFAATGTAVTNFPSSINAFLQARWLATNATNGQPWVSSDVHAWSLQAFGGTGFVTATDSNVATNPVVLIEGINTATAVNITVGHVFIVMNIPIQGTSSIYNFDSLTQSLIATPGPDSTVTLTMEDGDSVNVPTGEWIIVELAYQGFGGQSYIRYFTLGSRTPWTVPSWVASSTVIAGRTVMTINNVANNFYLADIEVYVGFLDANAQLVLDYIYDRYNYSFALPLTFPSNSSPQSNTI